MCVSFCELGKIVGSSEDALCATNITISDFALTSANLICSHDFWILLAKLSLQLKYAQATCAFEDFDGFWGSLALRHFAPY